MNARELFDDCWKLFKPEVVTVDPSPEVAAIGEGSPSDFMRLRDDSCARLKLREDGSTPGSDFATPAKVKGSGSGYSSLDDSNLVPGGGRGGDSSMACFSSTCLPCLTLRGGLPMASRADAKAGPDGWLAFHGPAWTLFVDPVSISGRAYSSVSECQYSEALFSFFGELKNRGMSPPNPLLSLLWKDDGNSQWARALVVWLLGRCRMMSFRHRVDPS